jgi:hypothetical protein
MGEYLLETEEGTLQVPEARAAIQYEQEGSTLARMRKPRCAWGSADDV